MNEVALFDARNRLFELIHRVEAGEEIATKAIAGLRSSREGVSLGRLSSRDLIRESRR